MEYAFAVLCASYILYHNGNLEEMVYEIMSHHGSRHVDYIDFMYVYIDALSTYTYLKCLQTHLCKYVVFYIILIFIILLQPNYIKK